MSQAHLQSAELEKQIQRNPHPDFAKVEASRPDYIQTDFTFTKTPDPGWTPRSGASDKLGNDKKSIAIDPYEEGRPSGFNYKLLISAIVPRPIGLISSMSEGVKNLSPFSYFQMVNHDPPMFVIGIAGSLEHPKDTLKNIIDTEEFTVNIISEHFVEAANYTSINAPFGVSEWDLCGLTQAPSLRIAAPRVQESIFSIECKLDSTKEWTNKQGKVTGVTIFGEGIMMHAREDAINKDRNLLDPAVLKPVARLGGISYSTITDAYELLRPDYKEEQSKNHIS